MPQNICRYSDIFNSVQFVSIPARLPQVGVEDLVEDFMRSHSGVLRHQRHEARFQAWTHALSEFQLLTACTSNTQRHCSTVAIVPPMSTLDVWRGIT